MSDTEPPPPGQMQLYDYVQPGLDDGGYSLSLHATIDPSGSYDPVTMPYVGTVDLPTTLTAQDLGVGTTYLEVVGPRISLSATEVAGVFPPAGGHGDYSENLSQIVMYRRTLPWERNVGLPDPPDGTPQQLLKAPAPWVHLLVLEVDSEIASFNSSATLADFTQATLPGIADPAASSCTLLEVGTELLTSMLPSLTELRLLAHARQVNVNDRILDAGSSDGWFSVVLSNRLPQAGGTYRACLVSLEGPIASLIPESPPASVESYTRGAGTGGPGPVQDTTQVLVLYSWTFTTAGSGTYAELMEGVDNNMIGSVASGQPPVAFDTGHVILPSLDRSGSSGSMAYRGPLVPTALGRDSHGPYHSADQARSVAPETNPPLDDVSYASAFELGRLLGAANARVAQDLLRWRRESFGKTMRASTIANLAQRPPSTLLESLPTGSQRPMTVVAQANTLASIIQSRLPAGDPSGLGDPSDTSSVASTTPGLNPQTISGTWGITLQQAEQLLGVSQTVGPPVIDPTGPVSSTLDAAQVVADTGLQAALLREHAAQAKVAGSPEAQPGQQAGHP